MKKQFHIIVLVVLALSALAILPMVHAQDDVFKVAVVAPSAKNDLAFTQTMSDALDSIKEEMGDTFEYTFQEGTFVVDDAAVALREWASSGDYDLIIAHGSQYGSIIEELAPEFPDVSFAWGTDVNTFGLDNVYAYTVAADQGGYINGYLAAQMSATGNIGVVGPIEVGDAKVYVDGFKQGAMDENPDVSVNVTYIQSFSDVPLATEAANAFVANGADVLTGTAQMVVGPIGVATENGLKWFGTQSSQAELAGDSGVAFQVYHWEVALKDIISEIQGGTGGEAYTLTLGNGGLKMELSDALSVEDKTFALDTITSLTGGIISGSIATLPLETEATPEAGG